MVNVFGGYGFVGSRFCELSKQSVIRNSRNDYEVYGKDVLYFISTVDNYNVHTNPYLDIDTNLTTLIKVLENYKEFAKDTDGVFNFISSWFVYGDVPLPAREDAQCNPKGFYSITKRAAEQLLISYCETFNLRYRIIRLANVLGEGDSKVSAKKNAIQYMINCLKTGEEVSLYDDGTPQRDYIYVDDVCQALNLILEKGNVNDIYNVGNGTPVQIGNIIEYARRQLTSKSNIKYIPAAKFHKIVQTKDMYLDNSKICDLGYTQKYLMGQIVDKLLK